MSALSAICFSDKTPIDMLVLPHRWAHPLFKPARFLIAGIFCPVAGNACSCYLWFTCIEPVMLSLLSRCLGSFGCSRWLSPQALCFASPALCSLFCILYNFDSRFLFPPFSHSKLKWIPRIWSSAFCIRPSTCWSVYLSPLYQCLPFT